MPKYTSKTIITREIGAAIAKKRAAKRAPVRVAGNASKTLGNVAVGQLLSANDGAATGDKLYVSRDLFAGAFELAEAERDATERIEAAAVVDPRVDGGSELLVPVDGVMKLIARERIVEVLRNGDASNEETWPFRSDLHLATYYAPLFWSCVHWCGGAEAIRLADCSVVAATVRSLLAEDEARRLALTPSRCRSSRR